MVVLLRGLHRWAGAACSRDALAVEATGGYQPRLTPAPQRARFCFRTTDADPATMIPGFSTARHGGPPLFYFSRRTMIAGELAKYAGEPDRWIRISGAIEPGTAMPDLGVTRTARPKTWLHIFTPCDREGGIALLQQAARNAHGRRFIHRFTGCLILVAGTGCATLQSTSNVHGPAAQQIERSLLRDARSPS